MDIFIFNGVNTKYSPISACIPCRWYQKDKTAKRSTYLSTVQYASCARRSLSIHFLLENKTCFLMPCYLLNSFQMLKYNIDLCAYKYDCYIGALAKWRQICVLKMCRFKTCICWWLICNLNLKTKIIVNTIIRRIRTV